MNKLKLGLLFMLVSSLIFSNNKPEKLLIINADDFGMCYSMNKATKELLKEGYITSATLMVPTPWFKDAASFVRENPDIKVGLHLTITSEWENYKWGPVTQKGDVLSLVDKYGNFYSSGMDIYKNATAKDVKLELENQVKYALKEGIKINHFDNHMGTLDMKGFLQIAVDMCEEYGIPYRFSEETGEPFKSSLPDFVLKEQNKFKELAKSKEVKVLDNLITPNWGNIEGQSYESFKDEVKVLLDSVKPGINELFIHPSVESEEIKAINPQTWQRRVWEYRAFKDPEIINYMKKSGIKLVSWDYLNN